MRPSVLYRQLPIIFLIKPRKYKLDKFFSVHPLISDFEVKVIMKIKHADILLISFQRSGN